MRTDTNHHAVASGGAIDQIADTRTVLTPAEYDAMMASFDEQAGWEDHAGPVGTLSF